MGTVNIRLAGPEDVDTIYRMDQICFPELPWSRKSYEEELVDNALAHYIIAEVDGEPAGFMGMWFVVGEGHITNVAVLPELRGQGIAKLMIKSMFELAEDSGIFAETLEVRVGNEAAISLYKSFGFKENGIRKNYYENNHEDALIMWRWAVPID